MHSRLTRSALRQTAVLGFVIAALLFGRPVSALPVLQLDIGNGTYNSSTESIDAVSQSFTLYAYLTPKNNWSPSKLAEALADNYYISAAIAPKVLEPGANLGSFSFNNTVVRATQDMVYGDPPLETFLGGDPGHDPGDLATHGIFETYFAEFSFTFNSQQRTTGYNVQDDAGQGPTPDPNGEMYYMELQVDTSALSASHSIHFDLYSQTVKNGGDWDINKFAPFSHDANSMYGGAPIPEPTSFLLFGSGLAALAWARRRRQARPPSAP